MIRIAFLQQWMANLGDEDELRDLAEHSWVGTTAETMPDNVVDLSLGIASRNADYAP